MDILSAFSDGVSCANWLFFDENLHFNSLYRMVSLSVTGIVSIIGIVAIIYII